MSTNRNVNGRVDELTKNEFCRILGAESWRYDQEPSQFFRIWEDFKKGKSRTYPWDNYRYRGQVEAAQKMCELIHKIYCEVSGLNVVQLEIQW